MFYEIDWFGIVFGVLFFGLGGYILYLVIRALRKYTSREK